MTRYDQIRSTPPQKKQTNYNNRRTIHLRAYPSKTSRVHVAAAAVAPAADMVPALAKMVPALLTVPALDTDLGLSLAESTGVAADPPRE